MKIKINATPAKMPNRPAPRPARTLLSMEIGDSGYAPVIALGRDYDNSGGWVDTSSYYSDAPSHATPAMVVRLSEQTWAVRWLSTRGEHDIYDLSLKWAREFRRHADWHPVVSVRLERSAADPDADAEAEAARDAELSEYREQIYEEVAAEKAAAKKATGGK